MNLQGKTVLITGAASGLGAQTARFLSQQAARLVLIDLDEDRLKPLAKETGGLSYVADVCDPTAIKAAVDDCSSQLAPPSVCLNCAGILSAARVVGKTHVMPLEAFEKVIRVNLIGTFNVLRLVAEKMFQNKPDPQTQEQGVIINTASIAAFEGQLGQAAYSASKAGIVGMTLPLAREFGAFGIRVMTIAPGIMQTPMMNGLSEKAQADLEARCVFPKRLGQPLEFAKLVLQIIENPLLNGETIRLDGGVRL